MISLGNDHGKSIHPGVVPCLVKLCSSSSSLGSSIVTLSSMSGHDSQLAMLLKHTHWVQSQSYLEQGCTCSGVVMVNCSE